MRTVNRFWRELWHTLEEWDDGERDWPHVDTILAQAAASGIDPNKAKALLAGLWACDRLLDDPRRQLRRQRAREDASMYREGGPDYDRAREALRADADREYERLKSLLIYGFWRDRWKSKRYRGKPKRNRSKPNVSQADIRVLARWPGTGRSSQSY